MEAVKYTDSNELPVAKSKYTYNESIFREGKSCIKCGTTTRYIKSGACVKCKRVSANGNKTLGAIKARAKEAREACKTTFKHDVNCPKCLTNKRYAKNGVCVQCNKNNTRKGRLELSSNMTSSVMATSAKYLSMRLV